MLRYLITAASVLTLVSGVALAETGSYGSKTVTITKAPYGKSITKRYVNHRGQLVTKKKTFHDGFYGGGSVTRSRTVTDPAAGGTITKSTTEIR